MSSLLLLTGCAVFGPIDAQRFDPPATYEVWWNEVAECTSTPQPEYLFNELVWWHVEDAEFRCNITATCAGLTRGQNIYLATPYLNADLIVRHEMLHVWIGDAKHTSSEWCTCPVASVRDCP